jgi:hypothetical protein
MLSLTVRVTGDATDATSVYSAGDGRVLKMPKHR